MPDTSRATYDIFISYRRSSGAETAKHLRDVLSERGYNVFFDTDSLRNGEFNKYLFDVIDACTDFIIILSPGALDRCVDEKDWVRLELARALEKGKNVIPIMSGDFRFPDELPSDIDDVRWCNGIAVNVEYFDAMIDRLTTFLQSKSKRKRRTSLFVGGGIALAAAIALLAFVLFGGRGGAGGQSSSSNPDEVSTSSAVESAPEPDAEPAPESTPESSSASDSSAAAPRGSKTFVDYALGQTVDVFNPEDGALEYSICVDKVGILPAEFEKNMWEKYDPESYDLLAVYCSVNNTWYPNKEKGEVSIWWILNDNTLTVKDADGFLLTYVSALYHGNDGKYLFETASTVPADAKGRLAFVFYVEKGTSEVTISIDSHAGEVAEGKVSLT
jgi:hypothetical protein